MFHFYYGQAMTNTKCHKCTGYYDPKFCQHNVISKKIVREQNSNDKGWIKKK